MVLLSSCDDDDDVVPLPDLFSGNVTDQMEISPMWVLNVCDYAYIADCIRFPQCMIWVYDVLR